MIILGHCYVTILLAKILIWAPFLQSMFFLSVLTPGAVKLHFLLIYKNILKRITTTRSECTIKHENMYFYVLMYSLF